MKTCPSLRLLALLSLLASFSAGCASPTSPLPPVVPSATLPPAASAPAATQTPPPTAAPTDTPPAEPAPATPPPTEMPTERILPPEPQIIEFQAADGQPLSGRYYPAAVNPAPLVVLMHWAGGDQHDWDAIAPWLQARSQGGQVPSSDAPPWLDPSWFPPRPPGRSFAVFTFTFRGCEGGCKSFKRDLWLLDAQAAMLAASQLDGIAPQRIVALGASIGADGAADGCAWLNAQKPGSCQGALSLSPGSYLTVRYPEVVAGLGALHPPVPAWCLYAQQDSESSTACKAAQGENYRAVEYSGGEHGMFLLQPALQPNAMLLILDFLQLTLGS